MAADAEIERVVRAVLDRLNAGTPGPAPSSPQPAPGHTLTVSDRVVTLATLSGRLEGVVQLVVPARAIVTPAVRDRLRELKIGMSYAANGLTTTAPARSVVLGVAETAYE